MKDRIQRLIEEGEARIQNLALGLDHLTVGVPDDQPYYDWLDENEVPEWVHEECPVATVWVLWSLCREQDPYSRILPAISYADGCDPREHFNAMKSRLTE